MGLRDVFQSAAVTARKALGDVPVSVNYAQFASTTYDASAGTDVATYSSIHGLKAIFDGFSLVQPDGGSVEPEDKMALIAAKELLVSGSAITPAVNDLIHQSGVTWRVQRVKGDPADALWTLLVRKP